MRRRLNASQDDAAYRVVLAAVYKDYPDTVEYYGPYATLRTARGARTVVRQDIDHLIRSQDNTRRIRPSYQIWREIESYSLRIEKTATTWEEVPD